MEKLLQSPIIQVDGADDTVNESSIDKTVSSLNTSILNVTINDADDEISSLAPPFNPEIQVKKKEI